MDIVKVSICELMNTKNFNIVDKIIANLRMGQILKYVSKDDVILDFGCGARSYLFKSVSEKIKNGTGVDYEVLSHKEENVEYINYKFTNKLPFKNETFDKIFLLAVLEHIKLDEVDNLFFEFSRILKDNGKIILTTPTPLSKGVLEFLAFKLKIISSAEIADHKKYYNEVEIKNITKKCGLKLVSYKLFQLGLNSCVVLKKNI